jgi:hypothetical protein
MTYPTGGYPTPAKSVSEPGIGHSPRRSARYAPQGITVLDPHHSGLDVEQATDALVPYVIEG